MRALNTTTPASTITDTFSLIDTFFCSLCMCLIFFQPLSYGMHRNEQGEQYDYHRDERQAIGCIGDIDDVLLLFSRREHSDSLAIFVHERAIAGLERLPVHIDIGCDRL